jgi:uncharacterized protein
MSRRQRRASTAAVGALLVVAVAAAAQGLPRLTAPVNDFAGVIGRQHAETMDRRIRALQAQTGDAVVVVTTRSTAPFGDIREYAVKLFENHGAGLGAKGQDNGVLVVLAVDERRVWIEVGYGLEPFITDGFAGEVSRTVMVPSFRQGDFGGGLQAGVDRLIARIAQGRNVEITGIPQQQPTPGPAAPGTMFLLLVAVFILLQFLSGVSGMRGRRRRGWGHRHTWSGWHSGVGPFGGGFGGGFGSHGGGFGGGFGGFGGGRSGGGGGGAGW